MSLVQNFFIKSLGSYENVGETVIHMEAWTEIAIELNRLGTFKTPFEWMKVSFSK